MAKNKTAVESTAIEVDLSLYYKRIYDATTLEEMDQIGADIAALNLGERHQRTARTTERR